MREELKNQYGMTKKCALLYFYLYIDYNDFQLFIHAHLLQVSRLLIFENPVLHKALDQHYYRPTPTTKKARGLDKRRLKNDAENTCVSTYYRRRVGS